MAISATDLAAAKAQIAQAKSDALGAVLTALTDPKVTALVTACQSAQGVLDASDQAYEQVGNLLNVLNLSAGILTPAQQVFKTSGSGAGAASS